MKKNITITGHEIRDFGTWKKHIVFEDRTKYEFGETRKDGEPTKAFAQWQELGLNIGASIEAEVAEEPETYNGKNFTRRKILFFYTDEAQPAPQINTTITPGYDTVNIDTTSDLDKELALEEIDTVIKLKFTANDHEKRIRALEKFLIK